jgi:hypothetical protein
MPNSNQLPSDQAELLMGHPVTSTFCTTTRTPKCTHYENETIKFQGSSNFISHLGKCKGIPGNHSFKLWSQQEDGNATATQPQPHTSESRISAQHQFLQSYTQHGLENPAKEVTRRGWRQHFVKGIVKYDLPFSLGEKGGMKKLFTYVLPHGYTIPGHTTVQHGLTLLQDYVNSNINKTLQVRGLESVASPFRD